MKTKTMQKTYAISFLLSEESIRRTLTDLAFVYKVEIVEIENTEKNKLQITFEYNFPEEINMLIGSAENLRSITQISEVK